MMSLINIFLPRLSYNLLFTRIPEIYFYILPSNFNWSWCIFHADCWRVIVVSFTFLIHKRMKIRAFSNPTIPNQNNYIDVFFTFVLISTRHKFVVNNNNTKKIISIRNINPECSTSGELVRSPLWLYSGNPLDESCSFFYMG